MHSKKEVALVKNYIPPKSNAGFYTCLHEVNWWLACVLEVCSDINRLTTESISGHTPTKCRIVFEILSNKEDA